MVTADHVGEGRLGLNIVVGWNEGEFRDVRGVSSATTSSVTTTPGVARRFIKTIWSDSEEFDFQGQYLDIEGDTAASPNRGAGRGRVRSRRRRVTGRAGLRHPQLRCVLHAGLAHLARRDRQEGARGQGRRRRSRAGSLRRLYGRRRHLWADRRRRPDYHHYSIVEHADWRRSTTSWALETSPPQTMPTDKFRQIQRSRLRAGAGRPADRRRSRSRGAADVDLSKAGLTGVAVSRSFDCADDCRIFCDEVLPRLSGRPARESAMTARVGLVLPSSNRMAEQEMVRAFTEGVQAHVTRLRMTGANHLSSANCCRGSRRRIPARWSTLAATSSPSTARRTRWKAARPASRKLWRRLPAPAPRAPPRRSPPSNARSTHS